MKKLLSSIFVCLTVASTTAALAEVYQSTDADGNTVFSDKPMPDSVEIDVEPPNVADPFAIPAAPAELPEKPEPQPEPTTQQQIESGDRSYDDDDDYIRRGRRWRRVGPRHPRPHR